jgi:hypothetical protein
MYMYTHTHIYIYICIHTDTYRHTYTKPYTSTHIHTYTQEKHMACRLATSTYIAGPQAQGKIQANGGRGDSQRKEEQEEPFSPTSDGARGGKTRWSHAACRHESAELHSDGMDRRGREGLGPVVASSRRVAGRGLSGQCRFPAALI